MKTAVDKVQRGQQRTTATSSKPATSITNSNEAKGRIKTRKQAKKMAATRETQASDTLEQGASPKGAETLRMDLRKGGASEASSL